MTKFETILKLSEIKGMLQVADTVAQYCEALDAVDCLIDDLKDDDDECIGCNLCHSRGFDTCQGHDDVQCKQCYLMSVSGSPLGDCPSCRRCHG